MNTSLHKYALITSPFIGIYGVSPFYIFHQINLSAFLILIVGGTISVYIVWLVNIFFELKFPNQNMVVRFILTYMVNVAIRLFFVLFFPSLLSADKYHMYAIITSLVLNAIVMVILHSIVTGDKKSQVEMQFQELKWQNTESQKHLLMQQLQPHFLFNALSILKSLIKENTEQAEAYTTKLSDFLRYTVQSQNQQLVPVKKELQFVGDYINLQKMRFAKAFTYSIEIPEEILRKNIPVLALQILVENIFKHNNFTEKKTLHFFISSSTDRIVVWNEKTSVRQTEKNNTGLANLNARYQLICNKSIEVLDNENEFTVTIPLMN